MPFFYLYYLEFWRPFCPAEQNHLCNFGRERHEEQFCDIILNLDQWFRRCHLKIFPIWSSGGSFVQRSGTIFCNFGRRYHEEQFCEFISNLGQWFRIRFSLEYFLSGALAALLFSGAEPFMQL